METILHNVLRKIIMCYVLCWVFIAQAMDAPISRSGSPSHSQILSFQPQKKILLWNNKDLKESGVQPCSVTPASLVITPHEDGILYTLPGKVYYCSKKLMKESPPHEIIHHSHTKFHPLIAVASQTGQTDNAFTKEVLVVASALNNRSRKSKVPKIQVIIARLFAKNPPYLSHNVFDKHLIEYIDIDMPTEGQVLQQEYSLSNIQAMKLHKDGKLLVLAFKDHLRMIDLETKIVKKSYFMPRVLLNARIVDVSMPVNISSSSDTEQYVAVANSDGIVDFKRYSQQHDQPLFSSIKNINTCSPVKKIEMAPTHDLLYAVDQGEVKIISINDWLEHSSGCVKNRIISHGKGNMVAIDEGAQYSSVHWDDNSGLSSANHATMSIYRENGTSMDETVVIVPDLPKKYVFINEKGQEAESASRILLGALRGHCVAAVTTEGCLYFWQLPGMYKSPTEENIRSDSRPSLSRRRSLSSPAEDPIKKYAQTSPASVRTATDEKRKSGKRHENVPKLNFLKNSSKESLRDAKGSASPSESPRKTGNKNKSTPRTRKSMPAGNDARLSLEPIISSDELRKNFDLQQADFVNDFNRKKDEKKENN
jgi:hypothetical protein